MKELNWGILGLGSIATSFTTDFNAEDSRIYAVGSRSDDKARQFAKEHGIEKSYGSYEELLADPIVDIIYIATPHSHHADLIMKSLENNKHVLCEKAIVMNSKQLKAAMKLASDKNLVLAEAMTIYHMPLYQELKKRATDGSLGKLKMIQVSFGSLKEADPTNRFFNKEVAGGALLDIGTYALSFARFFLSSQPKEILTTVNFFETGVDEEAGIILRNAENEMATLAITFRAKMPKQGVVAFEKGYFTVNDFPRADEATFTHSDGSVEHIKAGDTSQALNYEIKQFNEAVRTKNNTNSLDLTRDVMEIMDTLREKWGLHFDFE
ncbi:MAG: Gfo/Idh/MocA family oxidoreductase [Carnobacterium sp.]|uniref:Gfo/Idh/MocA family protein n=1 Tax=Carnobacterium sp. TaxID=48221 RepID=UPI003C72D780